MVTPTFAAGLGMVIAAVLVYPMSRMVFSYGAKCQVPGCGSGGSGGTGRSAQPGTQMGTGAGPAPHAPAPSAPAKVKFPPGQPLVRYQTMSQDDSSFTGEILIEFPARSVPASWALWISYPSGRIVAVSGGTWQADTYHSAQISGADAPAPGARQLKIGFTVDSRDPAGPPPGCTFDGKACHVVSATVAGSVNDVGASPFKAGRDGRSACGATRDGTGHHCGRPQRARG